MHWILIQLSVLCQPSGVDQFRRQFACLEEYGKNERGILLQRKYTSLPRWITGIFSYLQFLGINACFYYTGYDLLFLRERVCNEDTDDQSKKRTVASANRATLQSPAKLQGSGELECANPNVSGIHKASAKPTRSARRLLRSDSISASRCVGVIRKPHEVCIPELYIGWLFINVSLHKGV